MMKRTLLAAGALALVCTPAMAADFGPAVEVIVETVAALVASAVGAGLLWLIAKAGKAAERYGIKVDQEALTAAAGRLEVALERKLRAELGNRIPASLDINVKSEVAGQLVDYAAKQLPDTLRTLGMDRAQVKRLAHEMVADWTGTAPPGSPLGTRAPG